MAAPSKKLAESLEVLKTLQKEGGVAIRSVDLSRVHRERLLKGGFLRMVMKGWYIPAHPGEPGGESTIWYASFWGFCAVYLRERFGDAWSLSAEQSLLLHTGNRTVPGQLLVRTPKGGNKVITLLHGTSVLDVRAAMPKPEETVELDGLRLYSPCAALVFSAPGFFRQFATEARAALAMVQEASDLLRPLLEGGHSTIAGRLAGALRNIGRRSMAEEIVTTMQAAGYTIRLEDPFDTTATTLLTGRDISPQVNRMRLMWESMREPIATRFPAAPGLPKQPQDYLADVEDLYPTDAYHSLSIEGYRVSAELIEQVRSGHWNPDGNDGDRGQRDGLAARGYWQAYRAVQDSLKRVLAGENAGAVVAQDHGIWYRAMFAPSVTAGLVRPGDLAGYRNDQVYIRRSMHVPPRREAVRDLMPAFFDLLAEEAQPSVRVVLGHFLFVYIHPYMDGNGRMGRFLMNLMLASGGYPWTVIPLEQRERYIAALEDASVRRQIEPFARLLAGLVEMRQQAPRATNS
ncbi:Fic family protein [Lamprobacter modestohalophilus]|nr:Fic family protein [Lamprobacter modestohalophilus]